MGTAILQLRLLPVSLISRVTDKMRARLRCYREDASGAAAIEAALISPMFLFAMLYAATVAIKVTTYQKLSTASYAGVTYLQDEMMFGDYENLKSTTFDDGTETESQKDSAVIEKMKTVIKTASSLSLNTDDIDVDLLCGCPIGGGNGGGEGEAAGEYPEEWNMSGSYQTEPMVVQSSDSVICPSRCGDGSEKRILAEVNLTYVSKNLMGKEETLKTALTSRIR